MCVCVCMYIYIYIHTHSKYYYHTIYVYTILYIYIYIYIHTHTYTYSCYCIIEGLVRVFKGFPYRCGPNRYSQKQPFGSALRVVDFNLPSEPQQGARREVIVIVIVIVTVIVVVIVIVLVLVLVTVIGESNAPIRGCRKLSSKNKMLDLRRPACTLHRTPSFHSGRSFSSTTSSSNV